MANPTIRKSDKTYYVRLSESLAGEVESIAAGESNPASSVIRRLLSRAIASERRQDGKAS